MCSSDLVTVPPGESVAARIEVPAAACSIVDAAGRRVVEPGEFELRVGPSSRDTDLLRAPFTITAQRIPAPAGSGTPAG